MGKLIKTAKILGAAFAAVAVIHADDLKFSPEKSQGGVFDNALMSVTNQWNKFDLPKEDQRTKAMFDALVKSDASGKTDKFTDFSLKAFGVDLNDPTLLTVQSSQKLYGLLGKSTSGVTKADYHDSIMRGFYYFIIYKNANDFSEVSKIASSQPVTSDLAKKAANVGQENIKAEMDKLKVLGNAQYCFHMAAVVKASQGDGILVRNSNVTSDEIAMHFYKQVHNSLGKETDVFINQMKLANIMKDNNAGIRLFACADLTRMALGR